MTQLEKIVTELRKYPEDVRTDAFHYYIKERDNPMMGKSMRYRYCPELYSSTLKAVQKDAFFKMQYYLRHGGNLE